MVLLQEKMHFLSVSDFIIDFAPVPYHIFQEFLCKSCGHVNTGQEIKEEVKESKQEEEKPKVE